ncbi:hypothetical protein [uncultured Serinicoccus sp.]|uniref:hypothetical protein n=1 Tax=uncultured Serinicoccus sp. TaxID=735514 RepID=UPI002629ACFB|nr:hypothetical protein [uncultured Serinicoccus sp.]
MRTRDFSAAPPLARATVMLTVEPEQGRASGAWLRSVTRALEGPGPVRREWLRVGVRRTGVIAWYADAAAGADARRRVEDEGGVVVQVHEADPDGYSNGVWRAEDGRMAHVERFTPVGREEVGPPVVRERSGRGSGLRVEPVRTRADLRDVLRVPPWGTRRETHGVPLWHSTVRSWWTGSGPHHAHGAVQLYVVRDPWGIVHGRTTLHTDDRMDHKLGERTLLMGATEFAGEAALVAMVEYAEALARQRGRTRLLGPVSLLPNQVGGVVTSGWEEPGFLDGPWSPPHYVRDWEAAGFERVWTGSTWICPDLGSLDPTALFGDDPLPEGVVLRHADRRRLDEQLPVLRQMLNASFAELGYFTRIEADELAAATDGLAHLLDERLLLWLERGGEPVAFVLVVPDLTDFVRSTGGRLGPVDTVRLLASRRRYRREAVLIIKGTVPGARGQGLMRHLSRELLQGLQAGGYDALRVTFVEDDNTGSQAQFVAMGGRPLHGTCFYTRAVHVGGTPSGDQRTVAAPTSAVKERGPAVRLLARAHDWGRAPSAHNTQPWDVRVLDEDRLLLGWHADRELPVADAGRRDLLLSLGALALSLEVVAADLGLEADVTWGVDVDARRAAVVTLRALPGPETRSQPPQRRPSPAAAGARQAPPPWSVAELHARATVRTAYPQRPNPCQVAEIARTAGLGEGCGLLELPDDLVDELLPRATAHTLTGPAASELAQWLRLSPRHPRRDLDGLSATALGLSAAEARGLALLTSAGPLRRALETSRLDRWVARTSALRPRGAVLALWAAPGLTPDELGPLGGSLLACWLAGERGGWSAHPLSELLDEPHAAAAVDAHVTGELGHPAAVYAVWRCGRPDALPYRSPRLTD